MTGSLSRVPERAIAVVSAVKILTWFVCGAPAAGDSPQGLLFAVVTVQALGAGFLYYGGREARAYTMATALLASASTFTDWRALAASPGLALVANYIVPEAFLPYLALRFFSEFPRIERFGRIIKPPRIIEQLLLTLGAFMFGASLLLLAAYIRPDVEWQARLAWAVTNQRGGLIAPAMGIALAGSMSYSWYRMRYAGADERRRVHLLLAGLILGSAPALVAILVSTVSEVLLEPRVLFITRLVAISFLIAIPLITAYAVLAHNALDVRFLIRRALHYALARYTVLLITIAPVLGVLALLYWNRNRPIAEVVTGNAGMALLFVGAAGAIVLGLRDRVLRRIDRAFFREAYDSRQVLESLVTRCPAVSDPNTLSELLSDEIERALHPQRTEVLLLDPALKLLRSAIRSNRGLAPSADLGARLQRSRRTLRVDPSDTSDPIISTLPERDRHWIADGNLRLLVPMHASTGDLIGVIALGPKLSELPFDSGDDKLLTAAASAAANAYENHLIRSTPVDRARYAALTAPAEPPSESARECLGCGRIVGLDKEQCPVCDAQTEVRPVPRWLSGKYRLVRRLGSGGMGVVYLGIDETLGRPVAIKTLPRVDALHAARLHREARAIALVSHPHLASIYGFETWEGTPFVILEYLERGTLADRLQTSRLSVDDAIALALTVLSVLERIHDAGILHRDIKPANIGFDAMGHAKLLDFGVAHITENAGIVLPQLVGPDDESNLTAFTAFATSGHAVMGTIPYLSPEALTGANPEPGFDLWSLCVMLYECLAGVTPIAKVGLNMHIIRIETFDFDPLEHHRPDVPQSVTRFLATEFSPRRNERARSARELSRRLVALRSQARAPA